MSRGSVPPLIHYVRSLAARSASGEATDEALLDRFLHSRDDAAFAALVRRYGPLVFGVCRRVLIHAEDAEDAFQATLLVLAQKAGSIRRRGSLSSFLHGVAERIARKALRTRTRRRERCGPVPDAACPDAVSLVVWKDLRPALDEEIARLPSPYRETFILCHLEGHSNAEAARRLGCPRGTILSRLARARERLARRLARRGITLPAAALTMGLSVEFLRADVPPKWIAATVRLAGLLAEGSPPAGLVSAPVFALATEGGRRMLATKLLAVLGMLAAGAVLTASMLMPRSSPASGGSLASPLPAASAPETRPESSTTAENDPPSPPEPPKKEKKETPLETILRKWAEADAAVREQQVSFKRIDPNAIYAEKKTIKGTATFKNPDLWRIDQREEGGQLVRLFLLEDQRLHCFDAETKTEKIFPSPEILKGKEAGLDIPHSGFLRSCGEQILWLSFGPRARDLNARYKVSLAKEDRWYIYLDIELRHKRNAWFERGRIVLLRETYQVRQVWFERANRDEILVDFHDRRTNPQEPITKESLRKGLPRGWKREEFKDTEKAK